ncbi:hypothetical protein, partial [Desulfovibrio sp. 1214_IL3152]|uniref:hypothetical protein n=1 Tax=Desulfovibrio sp. 1214_IL3152 TaxID=3084056 RepID=UPI002FD94351
YTFSKFKARSLRRLTAQINCAYASVANVCSRSRPSNLKVKLLGRRQSRVLAPVEYHKSILLLPKPDFSLCLEQNYLEHFHFESALATAWKVLWRLRE